MLNPFFALDNGDSTNMGLTDKISTLGFSKDSASEKNVFIAFVAEYSVIYGKGDWPANDDKLIIADFPDLCFINGNNCCVIAVIDVQFTLMIFLISS